MIDDRHDFSDRLIQCEAPTPALHEKYRKEITAMLEKELSLRDRVGWIFWAVFCFAMAIVFGYAAVYSYGKLPLWGTVGFVAACVFDLAFAAMCAWIAVTGRLLLRKHPPAMAGAGWAITVIGMTLFLLMAPSVSDPAVGNRMLIGGLAFVVMAAVFLLASRTEQSELNVKEKLLEIEYRIAELGEHLQQRDST